MRLVETLRQVWRGLVGGTVEWQPASEPEKERHSPQNAEAGAKPSDAAAGPSSPAPEPEEEAAPDEEGGVNDLTVIRGIGPARQERLYAAGIRSYSQLAAASVVDVRKVLSNGDQQAAKVEEWIRRARELVA